MAMMPAYTVYDAAPLEMDTVEPVASTAPWRLRDMAQEIVSNRVVQYTGGAKQQKARKQPMSVSTHFDIDTCLARIRRDKAAVVRNAFEAAATAVLETLEKKKDEDEMETESINEDELPAIFKDSRRLDELRAASMDRALDNKEVAKRKPSMSGGKNSPGASSGVADTSSSGRGGTGGGSLGGIQKSGSATTKKTKKSAEAKANPGVKETPKFTRNTPASSAAALDSRLTSSRAILCTAANVAFETLTPPLPGYEVDVADVPQNPARKINRPDREDNNSSTVSSSSVSNMGAVVIEAQTLGQRVESVAQNAARRSTRRHQYRKDNFRFNKPRTSYLQVKNPFAWKDTDSEGDDDDTDDENNYHPCEEAITEFWANVCLPRLMAVLQTGAGHALLHDVHWESRHGRVANLLESLAKDKSSFGPHLIITTEPDVERFGQEFRSGNSHLRLLTTVNTDSLRALRYKGTPEQRVKLRKLFQDATGLPEAPFHVIITSYSHFLQDYLHFCQTPFEVVIVDDGVSWMAAAQGDPNSAVGLLWDSAMWSKSDQQVGLAGALHKEWDYTVEDFDEDTVKDAWIGLSARHRIMTSSTLRIQQRNSIEVVPVSGLVNFVAPHYADVVREEWDRSRIATDAASMEHFRKLLTRSLVVHHPGSAHQDTYRLAIQALQGELPSSRRSSASDVPELITDDQFVSEGKVAYSRRAALQWLGPPEESWLRYELGNVSFQPILEAMKMSELFGHMCEEVVTASSTTSSGATGQVTGTLAYRLAVRCGRHFGSEQGLRQHISALHAPPGTWLCRTCGSDCITSQARTHHERSCGVPTPAASNGDNANSTGAPSVGVPGAGKPGRQQHGPAGVVGKKKGPKMAQTGGSGSDEKDTDGSFRVPGYRGVWINQAGKHFVKINGERLSKDDEVLYFDNIDEAAKKHDVVHKAKKNPGKVELNFKEDGSRIIYEDIATSSTTGLGGSASSVVPALSVINIKDLPEDVKPLLRDPRQTSRTGGNSKRHVYAYRGVCRQARKGHDRWQSQISFMGVNHYLGTFDSEWDAAAIYAWAHLILYGEEATKQAQKEGEEAAAAYEQEKRDIAAGKIPAPLPKQEKKKRKVTKKKDQKEETADDAGDSGAKPIKKKKTTKEEVSSEKKAKVPAKIDKESIAPILAKGVGRAPVLAPRADFRGMSDIELAQKASARILAARGLGYCVTDLPVPAPVKEEFRPCAPWSSTSGPAGGAMLLGISSSLFGWDPHGFISKSYLESDNEVREATAALNDEYGPGGFNEAFRTVVQGISCVIGSASARTQRAFESLGLGTAPIGGAVGAVDCHIGGTSRSCSEFAACIRYLPMASGDFQFSALSSDDLITVNGQRVTSGMGSFPLFNEDVCTVGSRVFVFLLPTDT